MFYSYSEDELRIICRQQIESLELWIRRIEDDELKNTYGDDYFEVENCNGDKIIKKQVYENYSKIKKSRGNTVGRPVDYLFFDDLIYILCKDTFYKQHFKKILDHTGYNSNAQIRTILNRLVPTRNALSHANPISVRMAEQVVCYSNDIIDGIKEYYKELNNNTDWQIPSIIRITDSLGNTFYPKGDGPRFLLGTNFYPGDTYSFTIETDISYKEPFEIKVAGGQYQIDASKDKRNFVVHFETKNIGIDAHIFIYAISEKEWHKVAWYDQCVSIQFSILPPK